MNAGAHRTSGTRVWGRRAGLWPLRVPAHRASSAVLAGAYPFLAPAPPQAGVYIGPDALTGEAFAFDPWALYAAGELTNPNMLLAGVIGQGKSALAKSLALRSLAAGRRVYVPGDPKGEWAPLADAVGGTVIRIGPGLATRLNPLDAPSASRGSMIPSATVLAAVAATLLGRDLAPAEHTALHAALNAVRADAAPTLPRLVDALADPDHPEHVEHSARVDGPSTHRLDPSAPMVVLDLSALGSDDTALAIAMTCASAWLEQSLTTSGDQPGPRWVVYDEAWRLLRSPALLGRMQAQWKLSRAYGIANLLILHRLSDLDAVAATGTAGRAIADGLLADCSTRVIYRQEADQLAATARALGLTGAEREVIAVLPRGTGLWKLPARSHLVHHRLHVDELTLVDTDAAMTGTATNRAARGTATGGAR